MGLIGFLRSFETRRLLSSSNWQITIALITAGQRWPRVGGTRRYLALLATANSLPNELQRREAAARLMFRNTMNVGSHSNQWFWGEDV